MPNKDLKVRKEKAAQYYQEHKEDIKESSRQYYQVNKETSAVRHKVYREENSEEIKQYQKEYYQDNKEKVLKRSKEWADANPERRKVIAREWQLKKVGWTSERYDSVLLEQKSLCAICKKKVEGVLDADHEHIEPPKPRGLLCHLCNLGIGVFQDDPKLLAEAIVYLRKYSDA